MRRPAIVTSRRLPGGAPICQLRRPASARPLPPTNNPAEALATPFRKRLRSVTSSPSSRSTLERELCAELDQAPAHDLYRVQELVVRVAVARLLVEDGAAV